MAWINDSDFEASLKSARKAEAAVASFYIRDGRFTVTVDCQYPAGSKHPDKGDIFVKMRDTEEQKTVEVKSYGYSIESISNWPHIAIGRVHTMDGRGSMPDLVFAVSATDNYSWAMFTKLSDIPATALSSHRYKDKFSDDTYDMYVVQQSFWTKVRLSEMPE